MISDSDKGIASALVRLILRDDLTRDDLDFAMSVIDAMSPDEKTDLIWTQVELVTALISRVDNEVQPSLVAMYEQGLS